MLQFRSLSETISWHSGDYGAASLDRVHLANPEMRPRRVVVFNVGDQDTPQMRLAHYDHMVEALSEPIARST